MNKTYYFCFLLILISITSGCKTPSSKPPASEVRNGHVYVLNKYSNSISVIDGERDKIITTISLPDVATTFSVLPNGNLAVAVTGKADMYTPYKKEIYLFSPDGRDLGKRMTVKYVPDNMYIRDNRIGAIVHNTVFQGDIIPFTIIDLEKGEELERFELHGFVMGVWFEGNTVLVYTHGPVYGNYKTGLYRINLDDRIITEVMDMGQERRFGPVIIKNGKLYGNHTFYNRSPEEMPDNHTLQVIDLESKRVEKILRLQDNPGIMTFVNDKIYITHNNDGAPSDHGNKVSIVDSGTYRVEDILEVDDGPAGICYSKSLGKVYTANSWGDSVSVIDVKTQKLIKTIPTNQKFPRVIRCPE